MRIQRKCPKCASPVESLEHGDLVASICASCGWREEGMAARVFAETPHSVPVFVTVRTAARISGPALSALRSVSAQVSAIPLGQLQEQLASSAGISLGMQAEYRAKELKELLEKHGFLVERGTGNNAT